MDLHYRVEYAKSGRSKCKGCKSLIPQDVLRLAILPQSTVSDGQQTNWYHFDCFFLNARVNTVDDIDNFELIRVVDQDRIKEHVGIGTIIVPDKKGEKRTADKAKELALRDFTIEYAKSGRSKCRGCEQKILQHEVRVSKKNFESVIGKRCGGENMWYHPTCFAELRSELGYFESGNKLPGYEKLREDDKAQVLTDIPAVKQIEVPVKKQKIIINPLEQEAREQNKIFFNYRDQLKQLKPIELDELISYNGFQTVHRDVSYLLDCISDAMAFGSLKPCSLCNGQLVYTKFGYKCNSFIDEWTKCSNISKDPVRNAFIIPDELKNKYRFIATYQYEPRKRIFLDVYPSVSVKREAKDEANGSEPKVKRALPALYDMQFVILGNPERGKDLLKKQIQALGGKVVTKISKQVMAVISTKEMVKKKGSRISEAETEQVQVVPENFVDEAKNSAGKIPDLIVKKSICHWGSDPTTRLPTEPSTSKLNVSSKLKMNLKDDGGVVYPESNLQDVAHVYQEENDKYSVILSKTDVQENKNSYFKLQLLEYDEENKYCVFTSWGRIGTKIGGKTLEEYSALYYAKVDFFSHYRRETGNEWNARHNFKKYGGKFQPVEVDDGQIQYLKVVESMSTLSLPVQDLIKMIFDANQMQKLMLEFEIDTEKMPLGILSHSQIRLGLGVLSKLQAAIKENSPELQLIGLTNKFYTYIPHNLGVDKVRIIRDAELVKEKIGFLNDLLEREVSYNIIKYGPERTVDSFYHQLRTEINVLPKDSAEFQIVQEYLTNTHASRRSSFVLQIKEVYTVRREGEEQRFEPFRKLHNHKLLWYSSRITDFVGILSHGLSFATQEAPATGDIFGKGIYFSDMASNSANDCHCNPTHPEGLMLLCDVALGNIFEMTHADPNIVKPPDSHSVKGVGRTQPDPRMTKTLDDIEVPMGYGIQMPGTEGNALLYNKYVVYDVAQVNIKYLLKVKFH